MIMRAVSALRGFFAGATAFGVVLGMAIGAAEARVQERPDSFAELAEDLSPAVVNISTAQRLPAREEAFGNGAPFPPGSPFERFNELFERDGAPRGPRRASSLGSGFIIDPEGIIVTNNHVVEGADEIEVTLSDGQVLEAEIVGRDPLVDLAVLRVQPESPLPAVQFGSDENARVGDWVIAIGNPFGLGGSVTAGIISARNRDIRAGNYDDFIQTDASINQGNSGGPLFNTSGEVIGVTTAIITPTGASVGIGFAIPASLAQRIVDQLIEFGETRRGWLGVRIGPVEEDVAEAFGLTGAQGAAVVGVVEGSPADDAGIEPGDLILSFDGKGVDDQRSLTRIVADTPVGKTVRVEVIRDNKRRTFRVKLGRYETSSVAENAQSPRGNRVEPTAGRKALGMTLEPLNAENRRRYRIEEDVTGAVVTAIDANSDAVGKVAVGDVIVEVAFNDVENDRDAKSKIDNALNGADRPVLLLIRRGEDVIYETVRPADE